MSIEFRKIVDGKVLEKPDKEKIKLVEQKYEIKNLLNQKKQELDFLSANLDIRIEIDNDNKEFFLTIEPKLTYDLKVYNQMFSFIEELPEGIDISTSAGFDIDNAFLIVLKSNQNEKYNKAQRIAFLYHTLWSNLFRVGKSEVDKDLDKWLKSNDLIVNYLIEKEEFIEEMYNDSYKLFKAQYSNIDSITDKTIKEKERELVNKFESLFKVKK